MVAGPLIDTYGTRWMLLVSCAGSLVSYVLTAISYSMLILYLSRIPMVMQHGYSIIVFDADACAYD